MAITEDTANQPASYTGDPVNVSSASFSPQANTLIVVFVGYSANVTVSTLAMSDSLGGTWTLLNRCNGTSFPNLEVWSRYVATAPGAMTVKATQASGNNYANNGGYLWVRCLLGAGSTQPGATVTKAYQQAGSAMSSTITPSAAGSVAYGQVADWTGPTVLTALGNTTHLGLISSGGNGWNFYRSSAPTSISSTTYGYSNTQGSAQNAQTLTEILGPPAGVYTGGALGSTVTVTVSAAGAITGVASGSSTTVTVTGTATGALVAGGGTSSTFTATLSATGGVRYTSPDAGCSVTLSTAAAGRVGFLGSVSPTALALSPTASGAGMNQGNAAASCTVSISAAGALTGFPGAGGAPLTVSIAAAGALTGLVSGAGLSVTVTRGGDSSVAVNRFGAGLPSAVSLTLGAVGQITYTGTAGLVLGAATSADGRGGGGAAASLALSADTIGVGYPGFTGTSVELVLDAASTARGTLWDLHNLRSLTLTARVAAGGQQDVLAGAGELVLTELELTSVDGVDISLSQLSVSLGGRTAPGAFVAPQTDTGAAQPAVRTVGLLIDDSVAPGVYWRWLRVADNPEVHLLRVGPAVRVR